MSTEEREDLMDYIDSAELDNGVVHLEITEHERIHILFALKDYKGS